MQLPEMVRKSSDNTSGVFEVEKVDCESGEVDISSLQPLGNSVKPMWW